MSNLRLLPDNAVGRLNAARVRLCSSLTAAALTLACGVLLTQQGPSAGSAAGSLAMASTGRVYALQKCTIPVFRPRTLVTTCGSGNLAYERLRWSRWSRTSARARGFVAVRNTSAAHSGIDHVPVVLTLSQPVTCEDSDRVVFSHERYRLLRPAVDVLRSGSHELAAFC